MKSSHQYLPLRVIPYIDIASLTGDPQYILYSGKRCPKRAGIVTNIQARVLAWLEGSSDEVQLFDPNFKTGCVGEKHFKRAK